MLFDVATLIKLIEFYKLYEIILPKSR